MRTSRVKSLSLAWPSALPPLWWAAMFLGLLGIGLIAARFLARGMTLTVLAIPALILAILVLLRPQLGLYAVVLCAGVVRVKAGTGTGSVIVASLGCAVILCLCWLAHRVLHREKLNYLPPQVAVPAVALMFFASFSILWGRATLDPRVEMPGTFLRVQIAALLLFLVSVGLLFIGGDLLRDRQARNWIMIAIVAVGFAALPFRALSIHMPLFSVFGLFGVWFVALCWSNALMNTRLPVALRWLLGFGAIGWILVQLLTQLDWTSGWMPPCIALVVVTIVARPRVGVPMLLAMLAAAFAFQGALNDLLMSEEEQGSLGGDFGRLELWARNIEVLKDHLLFGTGPAGYALYYVTLMPDKAMSTHNNYIDILAETGIFGILSFLALLAGLGWLGWRTLSSLHLAGENPADRAACVAALGGLVAAVQAMALGDWVIPFVYNQTIAGFDHAVYTWLMLAILCGLWAQNRHPVSNYA